MAGKAGLGRVVAGAIVVSVLALAACAFWNGALGKGIPLAGQWDPTVGPVGPVQEESEYGLLTIAQGFQRYQDEVINEFIRFVDSRTPDHFDDGHIEGAFNIPAVYDEMDEFRELYDAFAEVNPPGTGLPIVIYCNGADCTDSHTLRDKLYDEGYGDLYVLFEGYPAWKDAGHPVVEPEDAVGGDEPLYPANSWRTPALIGMIAMILLAVGSALHAGPRKLWNCRWVALAFRLILGGTFLYASFHKIIDPGEFAKQVYGYGLLPASLINGFAMFLPWFEAVAGLLLIAGAFTRGAALAIAVMLLSFSLAVGYNVSRGHVFDCGCFKTAEEGQVSDPVELLFRDIAMLLMAVQVVGVVAHVGVGNLVGLGEKTRSASGGLAES